MNSHSDNCPSGDHRLSGLIEPLNRKNPVVPKKTLKENLIAIIKDSGLHGISSILNATSLKSRLTWLSILAVFFICAVLHTVATIHHAVKRSTHYNFINRPTKQLKPPDFTLCSGTGIFLDVTTLESNFREKQTLLSGDIDEWLLYDVDIDGLVKMDLEEAYALLTVLPDLGVWRFNMLRNSNFTKTDLNVTLGLKTVDRKFDGDRMRAIKYLFSHYMIPCDKVFSFCGFNNMRDHLNCCHVFQPTFNLLYGPCFVTQMQNINTTTVSPLNFMNDLWITVSKTSEPKVVPRTKFGMLNILFMYLGHEQYSSRFSTYIHRTHSEMYIEVRKVVDLENEEKCLPSSRGTLEIFQNYSAERCFAEKSIVSQVQGQDCYWPLFQLMKPSGYDKTIENRRQCTLSDLKQFHLSCNEELGTCHLREDSSKNRTVSKNALDNCLPMCERWEMKLTYRFVASIPKIIKKENEISMYIVYSRPTYQIMTESVTLHITDYLGMIGGLWGLWLGSSLITFIHILAIFISICKEKFCPRSL